MMATQIDRLPLSTCKAELHRPQIPCGDLYIVVSGRVSVNGEAVLWCIYDDSSYDVALTLWAPTRSERSQVAMYVTAVVTLTVDHRVSIGHYRSGGAYERIA